MYVLLKKLDCTHKLCVIEPQDDQNQADLPDFFWIAVKNPQKPIDFSGVLFGSAKYSYGSLRNSQTNSLPARRCSNSKERSPQLAHKFA
jgi:hypothetical protein